MKKAGKDGSFGAPKPLPGQAGYKMTEGDVLEKEAKEMEMRLQVLQERLTQQKMDETKPAGASRWKSSRPEKGSIRAYGKDVTDKFRTRILERENSSESNTRMSSTMPSAAAGSFSPDLSIKPSSESPRKSLSSGNFTTKDVSDWNTDDVGDWLNHLQLGQYAAVFGQNEINGGVLLDLTLDDLDYLNITVLAHRKTILRAIEEIRRQQKSNTKPTSLPAGLMRSSSTSRIDLNDSAAVGNSSSKSVEVAKPVHWSQLEPLATKQVKGGGQLPVNAADEGPIDEEAERLAFQQAVEEWRRADGLAAQQGKKMEIVREYQGGKKSSAPKEDFGVMASEGDDGMWKNPWGAPPSEEKKKPAMVSDASLLEGQLDEEREREEFQKAVAAWRNSNKKPVPKAEEGKSSLSESVSVGDSSTATTQSAQALADMLAKKMEQEQQEVVMKIQRQKEEAAKRLAQANQELEKLRMVKVNSMDYNKPLGSSSKSPNTKADSKDDNTPFVYSKAPIETDVAFDDSDNESPVKGGGRKNWTSPKKAEYKEGFQSKYDYKMNDEPERPSTVKIALVESIMGDPNEFGPMETDACVVVEYDSDN